VKIFLICPVRKAGDDVNERIAAYVSGRESQGDQVHWPKRDTKQDGDPIGIRICRDNRKAMFDADEVHVWYDPESRGSCFDIGMAAVFERQKPGRVRIANLEEALAAPASPQLVALFSVAIDTLDASAVSILAQHLKRYPVSDLGRHVTMGPGVRTFHTSPNDPGALYMYGMIFAMLLQAPARIMLGVALEETPEKSFNNLLLWLEQNTKRGTETI
jgi:hypothetical protein